MRQFDVLENPSPASRKFAPFVLVLQSHHLSAIRTVVVAPLVRNIDQPLSGIDFRVRFADEALTLSLSEMAAIDRHGLGPVIGSLAELEDDLRRGLDRLFTGF